MTPERTEAKRQADLEAVVRRLTVADAVGLALRDHRRRLGLSQRAYAAVRGRPSAAIARLESSAGSLRLDDVIEALEGTGFALALVQGADGDAENAAAPDVEPASWPLTELLASVRETEQQWYAPRPTPGRSHCDEEQENDAA